MGTEVFSDAPSLRESPTLSLNEAFVLREMVECLSDEHAAGFDFFERGTGLDRKLVREACRALAGKGLARFYRSLMNEDGEVAGAGYGATDAGRHLYWNMDIPLTPESARKDGSSPQLEHKQGGAE